MGSVVSLVESELRESMRQADVEATFERASPLPVVAGGFRESTLLSLSLYSCFSYTREGESKVKV